MTSACTAAFDIIAGSLFPLYCATITVPPVAIATKTLSKNRFNESTMLTALTAATPDELTIAVFSIFKEVINI